MTSLAACLIVRDEEEHLDACLEALGPFVDEICVLDTGSTDGTVAIAEGHGATVGRFEWCDDFAAARNACLELATSEWVLSVDADELLDPESAGGLRELLADEERQAYLVWIDNLDGRTGPDGRPSLHSVGLARLFRRRPEIRWARPVHESIQESLLALGGGDLEHSHLRLVHHGYLPQAIRRGAKHERNRRILERRLAEEPGDLFSVYKLAATCVAAGEPERAGELYVDCWSRGRSLAAAERARLPFLPLACAEAVRLETAAGRMSEAWAIALQGLEDFPTVSEVLYRAGELQRRAGHLEAAGELLVRARGCEAWTDLYHGEPGTRAELPLFALAKVAALAGDLQLAGSCLETGRELAPRHLEGRALAVRLDSVAGRGEAAWAGLEELLQEAPGHPDVLLLAGEMAWAQGEVETALGFFQGAREVHASRAPAAAWLAVAALLRGELEAGAELAEGLVASDLPEAGARALLAAVGGGRLELDPLFHPGAVVGEVEAWLGELRRAGAAGALAAFAAGAATLEPILPGVAAPFAAEG